MTTNEPRRLVDLLCQSPMRTAGESRVLPINVKHRLNLAAAEAVLAEHVPVLFTDEIADELSGNKDAVHSEMHVAALRLIRDTPRPMPAFPKMWVEGNPWHPSHKTQENEFTSCGAYIETVLAADRPDVLAAAVADIQNESRDGVKLDPTAVEGFDPRVIVTLVGWASTAGGTVYGPLFRSRMFLDADYNPYRVPQDPAAKANAKRLGLGDGEPVPMVFYETLCQPAQWTGANGHGYAVANAVFTTAMAVRACGLLNCSNVRMVEAGRTNAAATEKRRRRERLPWIKYHVLKLKVGGELREIQPRRSTGDHPGYPLHVVRGHFKHYGMKHPTTGVWCEPFLGKHLNRTHWVPPFARGVSEKGVVLRDYQMTEGAD